MKRTPLKRKSRIRRIGKRRRVWLDRDKEWSRAVKGRDRYRCQFEGCRGDCGALESHHVWPRSTYPDLRFTLENGITLGVRCHELWHRASTLNRTWWEKKFPHRAEAVRKVLDSGKRMTEDAPVRLSEPEDNERREA